MEANLTAKAKKLYACIQEKGGGVLEEWRMRDKTGLSHGSFCAARKELVAAGLLLLGKDVRKTTYTLRDLTGQKRTRQEADNQAEPAAVSAPSASTPPPLISAVRGKPSKQRKHHVCRPGKPPAEVQEAIMPRVTGDFPDLESWLLELSDRLGDCVDVSQSLLDAQEYIVFAEDYGEDSYTIRQTEDGGISVE